MTDKTPVGSAENMWTARHLNSRDEYAVSKLESDCKATGRTVLRWPLLSGKRRIGLFRNKWLVAVGAVDVAMNQDDIDRQVGIERIAIRSGEFFPILTVESHFSILQSGLDLLRLIELEIAARLRVNGRRISAVMEFHQNEVDALHSLERGFHIQWGQLGRGVFAASYAHRNLSPHAIGALKHVVVGSVRWKGKFQLPGKPHLSHSGEII